MTLGVEPAAVMGDVNWNGAQLSCWVYALDALPVLRTFARPCCWVECAVRHPTLALGAVVGSYRKSGAAPASLTLLHVSIEELAVGAHSCVEGATQHALIVCLQPCAVRCAN